MLADRPHGRRLTASEQQRLVELERLLADDPQLVGAPTGSSPWRRLRAASGQRGVAVGVIVAVLVAMVLLVAAGVVGGLGGAVATALALATTPVVLFLGRRRWERQRS